MNHDDADAGSGASFRDALRQAREDFRGRPREVSAENTGARLDPETGALTLPFLNAPLLVDRDGESITRPETGEEARPVEKILVLHHLAVATGEPLRGVPTAFREIPGGAFYNATYHAHTVVELIRAFGDDEAAFRSACESMGAVREEGSGVRMRFEALPRVPVTFCYWAGEEDMPPGAQVLFDASVTGYLPLEDIAVLGETLVHRVVSAAGKGGDVSLYECGE